MLVASGMSQPTDQQCGRRVTRAHRVLRRACTLLGSYLLLSTAHCTFPEYNTPVNSGAAGAVAGAGVAANAGVGAGATSALGGGANGDGGMGGGGTDSGGTDGGGTDSGGTDGLLGGAGGEDNGQDSPECAPKQWPVDRCEAVGCVRRYPAHCYDGEMSGDEVAVDCGGGCHGCTNEACTSDDDCLSGSCLADGSGDSKSCYAPLRIQYTSHEQSPIVGNTTWSVTLLADAAVASKGYAFKDLKIRYYFDRSGIVEPLLLRSTQSNLTLQNGQSRGLSKTSWAIGRVEHVPDALYDAYVEVAFDEAGQLFPGDQLDLYQQLMTGDSGRSTFDQRINYSFAVGTDLASLHITVFYKDQLVWGLEPPPATPRSCFVRGVNLNGPAVVVNSNSWQSASQAMVTTTGSGVSQTTTPYPAISGGVATMLNTATRLQTGAELNLPTANGVYLAYLYATSPSANDAEASLLTVQGEEPDSSQAFRSQVVEGGQAWARLGPYRVDITTGKLTVGVSKGAINLAGVELWYPD